MDPALQELSVLLSEAAVRNAAATVADRISAAKARKRDKETIAALEDIVNELLADKSELVRIAQAFDDELVAQRLSSDDVNFITENLLPLIRQLMEVSDQDVLEPQMLDTLKSILAAETLTIMQLIGFNYRQAIGKPLTELAAAAITSRMPQDQTQSLDLQQALVERDIALAELAGDPEAWARFVELRPRGTQ